MPWPKGKKFSKEHIAKRSSSIVASGSKRKKPELIGDEERWKCGSCGLYKSITDFYLSKKTESGSFSVCKQCHISTSIRNRDKDNARRLSAEYMRRARENNPDKFKDREKAYSEIRRMKHKERVQARAELNAAVKSGKIAKPDKCEVCGNKTRITGHHKDYSKPLLVNWLCYSCHGIEHRKTY